MSNQIVYTTQTPPTPPPPKFICQMPGCHVGAQTLELLKLHHSTNHDWYCFDCLRNVLSCECEEDPDETD